MAAKKIKKNKGQLITEALEAKDLEVREIDYEGFWHGQGWIIEISDKTPFRGSDNPIIGKTFEKVMAIIARITKRIEWCPNCGIGLDRDEERMQFCQNCRTDFSEE